MAADKRHYPGAVFVSVTCVTAYRVEGVFRPLQGACGLVERLAITKCFAWTSDTTFCTINCQEEATVAVI